MIMIISLDPMISALDSLMSVVFIGTALVMSLIVLYIFYMIAEKSFKKDRSKSNIFWWNIKGIVALVICIVLVSGGWTLKQKYFCKLPTYQNPTMEEEIKKTKSATAPSPSEIAEKSRKMKEKDEKRHEKALNDYEKNMQKELKEIKERNKSLEGKEKMPLPFKKNFDQ